MAFSVKPSDYKGYKSDRMTFVQADKAIHDQKFETKPVSYARGCWRRFRKNKGSIVAGAILLFLVSFAIIAPMTTSRDARWSDANYSAVLPKSPWFETGSGFWDGTENRTINEREYQKYKFYETEDNPIVSEPIVTTDTDKEGETVNLYTFRFNTYAVGAKQFDVSLDEFDMIKQWENKNNRKILLPLIDFEEYCEDYIDELVDTGKLLPAQRFNQLGVLTRAYNDVNIYYKLEFLMGAQGKASSQTQPVIINDSVVPLYATDTQGDLIYYEIVGNRRTIRVDYNNYYEFKNGEKCFYLFGSNANGYDLFVRLASGARLSLLLGISVSAINLIIGLIYGAIAGYYGGTVDLVMERITDILSAIPFIIMANLFQMHFAGSAGPVWSLLFAFVATGWIGTAATTRMQFYRFKDQEYVLASRTLGAKDMRLIFVDILPNALGTLITSSVLMIPGVIFSESSLSYLNIIDLSNSAITSVGTLLNEGSDISVLKNSPHLLLFPALFISLLMICFNLIGNGLRDAFNPTLRGED